jgi:hypothetical protein
MDDRASRRSESGESAAGEADVAGGDGRDRRAVPAGRTVRFRLDDCYGLDDVPSVLVEGVTTDEPLPTDVEPAPDGTTVVDLPLVRGAFVVDVTDQPSGVTRHQVSTAKGLWMELPPRVAVEPSALRRGE